MNGHSVTNAPVNTDPLPGGRARCAGLGPVRLARWLAGAGTRSYNPTSLRGVLVVLSLVAIAAASCGGEEDGGGGTPGCTQNFECGTLVCVNGQCMPDPNPDTGMTSGGDMDSSTGDPDADMTDGDMTDGDMTDGDMTDSDMVDSDMTDSTMNDSDMTDGDMTDGDMTDADTSDQPDTTPDTRQPDVSPDVPPPPPDVEPYEGCMGYGCPGVRLCDQESDQCVENDWCLSEQDCDPGRTCYQGACSEPVNDESCISDDDCMEGWMCLNRLGLCERRFGCETDTHCAGDRTCFMGFCVDCSSNDECPGGQVCEGGGCAEATTGCSDDIDCLTGRSCVEGACQPSQCMPDEFNGNQSRETAAALTEGSHEATICQDEDWFTIEVAEGDGVAVWIEYDADGVEAPIELDLLDSQFTTFGRASDTNNSGYIINWLERVEQGGTYYINVLTFLPVSLEYTIHVQTIPSGICRDDVFEGANGNDRIERATILEEGTETIANLCAADMDWYRQRVGFGETLRVTVTTRSGAIPGVDLFKEDTSTFISRDTRPLEVKVLEAQNLGNLSDYLIRVFPPEPDNNSDYLILIEVE